MSTGHRSPGDPEGNGLAALLEKEAVVSGFKIAYCEEPILERQRLEHVRSDSGGGDGMEGQFLPGQGAVIGNPDGFACDGMN